jgi:enediyne biosynthesis protein E4
VAAVAFSIPAPNIAFEDISAHSGITAVLSNGAVEGEKHQIETMLGGVALLDYDGDGLLDIFLANGARQPAMDKGDPRFWNRLYRNRGNGVFEDVTARAGVAGQGYSMGVAAADYDNDGRPDLFVAGVGRNMLYRNRGDGTFEDVTAKSGIFDTSSKALGVALLDSDRDGWPDLAVANDTQPNKLYRNRRDGTFEEIGVRAGIAFSEDGRARAGMGIDAADFDNSGASGIAVTNFDNEMVALFRPGAGGAFADIATRSGVGGPSRSTLGFGCAFFDADLDGRLDLAVANGHIDATARNLRPGATYAQPPHLFVNLGGGRFRDAAAEAGAEFAAPKVARGLACGDFDNDGDVDLLITTNGGPALLYRNDLANGNRSLRLRLTGTKSNRDGIGAVVRAFTPDGAQMRTVRSGSSYLSQSELAVTFGLGKRDAAQKVVVEWPSGATQEFPNVRAGKYALREGGLLAPA